MNMTFLGKMQRLRQICLMGNLPGIISDTETTTAVPTMRHAWTKRCVYALLSGIRSLPARRKIVEYYLSIPCITPSPKMSFVYDMLRVYPKIVVFSAYRVFLEQVMSPWFDQIGVDHRLFCGGSRKRQQGVLKEFTENTSVQVLLVVKSAGSEGLNLTAANVCIIMDPHFNRAQDEQAAQRIDRIGQEKEVIVRKLYMEGSIDNAMRLMQQDKQGSVDAWLTAKTGNRTLAAQGLFLKTRDTVK